MRETGKGGGEVEIRSNTEDFPQDFQREVDITWHYDQTIFPGKNKLFWNEEKKGKKQRSLPAPGKEADNILTPLFH